MSKSREPRSLEQLLDRVEKSAQEGDRVSLGAVVEAVGSRSFGPLLLVAGLIALSPVIGDIPGMPTIVAILVALTAGQLLFGRRHFWLPRWLLRRSLRRDTLCKVLKWLQRPARFIDRLLRPRLTLFTQGAGVYVIALVCIVIAATMPAMEVVPFTANAAGAALTAFGLSLIAHDGLLALLAFAFTAATFGLVIYGLL